MPRDEALPTVNTFIMNEWQIFTTKNVASKRWLHDPNIARPETLFAWSKPKHAYAGQIVQGPDKRFYLSSAGGQTRAQGSLCDRGCDGGQSAGTVEERAPCRPHCVAKPAEPNEIQNIDPTVFVDKDRRVYLYWGTFGRLRGTELEPDMVTPKGAEVKIER